MITKDIKHLLFLQNLEEKPENFHYFIENKEIIPVYGRTLQTANSWDIILLSGSDWKKINCCRWFLTKERGIINQQGTSFEEYVGITTKRKPDATHYLDFCRYNYEPTGVIYERPECNIC